MASLMAAGANALHPMQSLNMSQLDLAVEALTGTTILAFDNGIDYGDRIGGDLAHPADTFLDTGRSTKMEGIISFEPFFDQWVDD